MKRIILVSLLLIVGFLGLPSALAENGKADPKPTNCGKMPCSFFAGKYFMFGDTDDYTMENGDRLPDMKIKDDLHTNLFAGGSIAFLTLTVDGKLPIGQFKVVLDGEGAIFGPAPIDGITFSDDRKTVYVSYSNPLYKLGPSGQFDILLKKAGLVRVTSYGEISEGVYSQNPTDLGEINVYSRTNSKLITCTKGNIIKKVSSVNLKCSAGYKKK
jgi:hypothetical protein